MTAGVHLKTWTKILLKSSRLVNFQIHLREGLDTLEYVVLRAHGRGTEKPKKKSTQQQTEARLDNATVEQPRLNWHADAAVETRHDPPLPDS